MTNGNVKDAIITAVNMGRDTDCLTAVAGGIAQVDYATTLNPFTNSKRTLRENADGLYDAYAARLNKAKKLADYMGV